jgi:carbonic anhydrase
VTRVAEENVLLQVEQLRRFDVVKQAEAKGEIDLFAWMFHLETGKVHSYDSERGEFLPVEQGGVQRVPPPASTSRKRS